jgi:hypothetical protein
MTLDKHEIQGLSSFKRKTLEASTFEDLMKDAGYSQSGSAPGKIGRVKVWWNHATYPLVESIYSSDKKTVITAYHPEL